MPGVVHFWGPYPYRSAFHATDRGRGVRAGAAAPARHHHGRGPRTPSPRSCSRRSSAPTASSSRRDGYLAGVRELCDRARHRDDRRRGDGRLRPLRRVVRRRPLGRHARPDLLRQGRQLRLRARSAAWSSADAIADTFADRPYPGGLTYSGPPAGLRVGGRSHQHLQGGGHRRARPHARRPTSSARRSRELAGAPPVASARCAASACSGRSSWCATARPASRSCRTTPPAPAAAPMTELAAACKAAALWPFTHFNRIHVVPPCTTRPTRSARASPILDEALERRPPLHR